MSIFSIPKDVYVLSTFSLLDDKLVLYQLILWRDCCGKKRADSIDHERNAIVKKTAVARKNCNQPSAAACHSVTAAPVFQL